METPPCTRFLSALLFSLAFTSINLISAARPATNKASTEFIRTACGTTTYPQLCFTSLAAHASVIQTNPKLLASTALSVTLATARSTSSDMSTLLKRHGLTPREVSAMRDCVEELGDSVDQLKKSMGEMSQIKSSNFGLMINDIQTWVSAALTDEDTCANGFTENAMTENVRTVVNARIVNIAHMTSNALALINSYASLHH